jgi:hypothetical protein
MIIVNIAVNPARRTDTATSFGVLGLSEDSTSFISLLRNVSFGSTDTLATRLSVVTTEPPSRVEPTDFRTSMDSPVRRDSSTIAIPSRTSESMGTRSPLSILMISPFFSCFDVTSM